MAILRVKIDGRATGDFELPRAVGATVELGSQADSNVPLPHDSVPPQAGHVMRSNNVFFVFIPPSAVKATRNGEPIFWLSVLRNEDVVKIEQAEITYLEIGVESLRPESLWIGTECPFCLIEFKTSDRVIYCPKCEAPYHYETCWSRDLQGETCTRPGCGYSIDQAKPYTDDDKS